MLLRENWVSVEMGHLRHCILHGIYTMPCSCIKFGRIDGQYSRALQQPECGRLSLYDAGAP